MPLHGALGSLRTVAVHVTHHRHQAAHKGSEYLHCVEQRAEVVTRPVSERDIEVSKVILEGGGDGCCGLGYFL